MSQELHRQPVRQFGVFARITSFLVLFLFAFTFSRRFLWFRFGLVLCVGWGHSYKGFGPEFSFFPFSLLFPCVFIVSVVPPTTVQRAVKSFVVQIYVWFASAQIQRRSALIEACTLCVVIDLKACGNISKVPKENFSSEEEVTQKRVDEVERETKVMTQLVTKIMNMILFVVMTIIMTVG